MMFAPGHTASKWNLKRGLISSPRSLHYSSLSTLLSILLPDLVPETLEAQRSDVTFSERQEEVSACLEHRLVCYNIQSLSFVLNLPLLPVSTFYRWGRSSGRQ